LKLIELTVRIHLQIHGYYNSIKAFSEFKLSIIKLQVK